MQVNNNTNNGMLVKTTKTETITKVPRKENQEQKAMPKTMDSDIFTKDSSSGIQATYARQTFETAPEVEQAPEDQTQSQVIENIVSDVYSPSEGMSAEAIDFAQLAYERAKGLQDMITKMAGQQVDAFSASTYKNLTVTPEQALAAQESISEGGEWSAESVAGRILDMAKALSGGDDSKFELLKDAVIKGFGAAEEEWGEEMPQITKDTYDLVMQGFEDWSNEINGITPEENTTK